MSQDQPHSSQSRYGSLTWTTRYSSLMVTTSQLCFWLTRSAGHNIFVLLLVYSGVFCTLLSQWDLANQMTTEISDQLDNYCDKNGFVGWFRTSAKEGYGIDDAVRKLLSKVRMHACVHKWITDGLPSCIILNSRQWRVMFQ